MKCLIITYRSQFTLGFVSAANFPPNITGPDFFMVSVNMEASFEIRVMDENLQSFTIANGAVEGGVLTRDTSDPSLYVFTWTPTRFLNRTILFLAVDNMNASTQYQPRIEFCSCLNGGECTLNGLLDQTANPIDLNCICNPGKVV